MKFLDKFYNHSDVPQVNLTWAKLYSNNQTPPQARSPSGSFWWKDILKLFHKYQTLVVCLPSKGNTILFWTDNWSGQALKDRFPHIFSFTRKPKCSISFFTQQEENSLFSLPLSLTAANQLSEITNIIQNFDWDSALEDSWTYYWGLNKYQAKKAYSNLIGFTQASPFFKWLWASSNLGHHKFFFWLLIRDRLNTRNLLRRKNMVLDNYHCVLCHLRCEETCFHLFFDCPFSRDCWSTMSINWDTNLSPLDMMIQARQNFGSPIFREIIITACWIIWTTRNGVIFNSGQINLNQWKRRFKDELGLVCNKSKNQRQLLLQAWQEDYSQQLVTFFPFGHCCLVPFFLCFSLLFSLSCTVHSFI